MYKDIVYTISTYPECCKQLMIQTAYNTDCHCVPFSSVYICSVLNGNMKIWILIQMDKFRIQIVIEHAKDKNVEQREVKDCISPVHLVFYVLISNQYWCNWLASWTLHNTIRNDEVKQSQLLSILATSIWLIHCVIQLHMEEIELWINDSHGHSQDQNRDKGCKRDENV